MPVILIPPIVIASLLQRNRRGFNGRPTQAFVSSPWFVAYLVRYGMLHVKNLSLVEESVDFGRSMVPRNDGDPQDIGAIDALTYLLGLEGGSFVRCLSACRSLTLSWLFSDDEPGLSSCQAVDLRLEEASLSYYGDTIGEWHELDDQILWQHLFTVHSLFQKDSTGCSLSGRSGVKSIWASICRR
jgi:hypothetical protein